MHLVIEKYLTKKYKYSCKEEAVTMRKIRAAIRFGTLVKPA